MGWIHSAIDNFPIISELADRRFAAFIRRKPHPRGEYKIYVQKKHRPTAYTTKWQHRSRTLFKRITTVWNDLTEFEKLTWDNYHMETLECANAYFQFIKNHMQLLYPRSPGVGFMRTITCPPQHPEIPQELALDYVWPEDMIEITWKDTYGGSVWIQTFRYGIPGLRRHYIPRWKYLNTYPSNYEFGYVYPNFLHPGRTMAVSIRALNPRGEVSPYAEQEEEEVPERPVIKISANPREGPAPLTVTFTDLSTGLISWHLWDFGDGYGSDEQHPAHIYDDPGGYHVRLYLGGPGESTTRRTYTNYITATDEPAPDPHVYVSDSFNHRIFKRLRSDLSFVAKIGTEGTGIDQFKNPMGIACDGEHLYIAERDGHRIQKRNKANLAYVDRIGSYGSGNDQFSYPSGMCVDETYIYVGDGANDRIVKRSKSTLAYVSKIGSLGSGDDQFDLCGAIACDDTHLYVVDVYNHRIHKRLKSDLSLVQLMGSEGSGNDQFYYPLGISCDDTYVFVGDALNHRVHVRLKSDLSYVRIFGSYGSGNDEFIRPMGSAPDDDNIIITDRWNDRIKTHRISDGAYVQKIGSPGSGDDQFNQPTRCATQNPFSL